MEAVPKLPLISFELKVSSEKTHFGPKLKQYISDAYREDPDSYNNEMHQLESLRSAAVRPTIDSDGINAMTKYFCQLRSMQSRFPMAKGQPAACTFSWRDIYANMSCNLPDLRFEMACILYNIGALHTQLGASEPRTSPESLKAACTHYQNAAWAFMYLREHYAQPAGVDVSADNMRLLQEICFAQAQECILDKSIQDTRKPSVVGAVATQVMLFYKNALALLGPSTGTDNIHEIIGNKLYNYWHRYLSFKLNYTACIVCLYQGLNAEEQQKMGERLAFYQQAADKLAEARKLTKYIEPVQITQEAVTFTNDVVEGKRKAAKNENEFIYHEEVPAKDLLADLKPVCLVKALPINCNDPEVSGPDIFSRLVPMGAHEASSLYSEEKAKLLRQVVNHAEVKNTELMEFMSSLQLDQLEVLDADQKIPGEIVDRCAAMNHKSEIIQLLVDSMNNLAEIISDVEDSLSEIKIKIQEEIQKEKEFQKVMGPRPPSIVQTELSREFNKYQEAHSRTNESNQVLHKAMTLHIANLKLLAQPLEVLKSKIPSIEHIEGLDRQTMSEMRRVVGKAREMQTQRDTLIQQLREDITSDDITSQLLARSSESAEEIFKQELEKHTPKVKIIEQNLAAQENIINKLTSLYAAYGESRRLLSDVLRKRDGLIHALITSYDAYEELLGKAQKGLEFYKKLSVNVNQLQSRLRSTCQVQEEERAQQLAKQGKAPLSSTPPPPSPGAVKGSSATPPPSGVGGGKLKDYLPYMKNRGASRSQTPQAQDQVPTEQYYPESIYPTSVRPAPLGSEATDPTQTTLTDGTANISVPNPYNRFNTPYSEPYPPNYAYPATSKAFDGNKDDYGYSAYTPNQYPNQTAEPQYSNPYYAGNNANPTTITDSPNTYTSQPNQYQELYSQYGHHMASIPEAVSNPAYSAANVQDVTNQFTQIQVSNKEGYNADYSQTFYNSNYPQTSTPNLATYSHAPQNANTNMVSSQIPTDYNSLNYPYSADPTQNQYGMTSQQVMTSPYGVPQNFTNQQDIQNQPGVSNQTGVQNQYGTQNQPSVIPQSPQSNLPQQNMPVQTNMPNQQRTNQQITNQQGIISQPGMSNPSPFIQGAYNNSEQSINTSNPYSMPEQYYLSQGYTIYTNAESIMTSTTSVVPQGTPTNFGQPYSMVDGNVDPAALAQLDAMDQPIKSHVTGEALSIPSFSGYNYDQNTPNSNFSNVSQQSTDIKNQVYQPEGSNINQQNYQVNYALVDQQQPQTYSQTFQNHPGYTFNNATGNYEYSYGSQNSYFGQANEEPNAQPQVSNWSAQGVYTSAGGCDTVQSPSEAPQNLQMQPNNQEYYNAPYGYQTITNQANENVRSPNKETTNYGANINQSTYMQSGPQTTNVTFSNTTEQVTSPKENLEPPTYDQNDKTNQNVEKNQNQTPIEIKEIPKPEEIEVERAKELSTIDLLSDIDFSVETKPLMPEIKVPQISESVMKKVPILPKTEPAKTIEEVIERPAKRDLFSDAKLLNRFTAEVKALQKLVDSFTERTVGGLTVLDSKWKNLQEVQAKENMTRSKSVAASHAEGSAAAVVPYNDSRLTLKNDRSAYLNASYYKQLASWCIPLVISKDPSESEHSVFWRSVVENKISCVVCLLSEIEVQGKCYWPTAKGQSLSLERDVKVTLEDVTCTVHWTERKLTVAGGKTVKNVTHYQINVFPAKIACSPLVLLSDKILSQTYDNRLSNQLTGALIQCENGAGRSSVMALLIMVMCQVRAGQIDLCDMLEAGCVSLYKHRTNVLEDTKYLFDAYRTALFYVQGVLCSGTPMFNGEAVIAQSPTHSMINPAPAPSLGSNKNKLSRESFEEMKQAPGLKSGDMKDPLNFLDPLWSLKKK